MFRRRPISLSIRISIWLITVAIVPLLVAVGISEWYARPMLMSQAQTTMKADANTHAQLINNYFVDRMREVLSLAQTPIAQDYLIEPAKNKQNAIVQNGQAVANYLDPHYILWVLFDMQGKPLISYPSNNSGVTFQPHGRYVIPPEDAQKLLLGKPFVSAVYYDPASNKAMVDIYAPSFSFTLNKPLGFVRATLTLDYIWSIVNGEKGANGAGSYTFILDENGVRIADPDPHRLMTSIADPDPDAARMMREEARFGKGVNGPQVQAEPDLYTQLQQTNGPATFDLQPAGQSDHYQVARQAISSVPWTYLVLIPDNTIIAVANQQLIIALIVAGLLFIPVSLLGFAVGRRISSPVLRTVQSLYKSSEALAQLASKQKNASTQQSWVVDSTQRGMNAVQYYNNAIGSAADLVDATGRNVLNHRGIQYEQSIKQAIVQMVKGARYIKQANDYQNNSNYRLSTALNVTTEVSEQLATSAEAALETSRELQQAVEDLRYAVGEV